MMNSKLKIFFSILLTLKTIYSVAAVEPLLIEHDVTKQIDEWIRKLFKFDLDFFSKLFDRVETNLYAFDYTMKKFISEMGSILHFQHIHMNNTKFKSPQLFWKLSNNEINFLVKNLSIEIMGNILTYDGTENFTAFDTSIIVKNSDFTFTMDRSNTTTKFIYDFVSLWYDCEKNVKWESDYDRLLSTDQTILEEEFKTALPALLHNALNDKKDFINGLKAIFKAYFLPKQDLAATHTDFFTDRDQKYYYVIPKIPFFSFYCKNIVIKGIWNLEWVKISEFAHTLMIRNVQGNFVLDFGAKPEKPVKLSFKIDYLTLSVNKKTINAEARCYSVSKHHTPVSYRQSALIMQRIESAIANSIFPTLKYRQTYDIDSPVGNIKLQEYFNWKFVKNNLLEEWIPFNDNE